MEALNLFNGCSLDLSGAMYQDLNPTNSRQESARKAKPDKRGTSCCSGCGCSPWILLLIAGVLAYPYFQRGLFFPATAATQPICRQIRFFSAYAEAQEMPAMFFLVDRHSDSSWLAVQVGENHYLWSEFGSVVGSVPDTVAQLLQDGNMPPLVQDTVNGIVGLAASPHIPQVALLSPILQDCSLEDQIALEHNFARDVQPAAPTGARPDPASREVSSAAAEETQGKLEQENFTVYLGTIVGEEGALVRSGPGLEYEVVRTLPLGHLVGYTAVSEDRKWLRLESGDWISVSLVAIPEVVKDLESTDEAMSEVPNPSTVPGLPVLPTPSASGLLAAGSPEVVREELRQQALNHVNQARAQEGLSPVYLGDNEAAQTHADEMARNQYLSHWNMAGLTPDMRYTLGGGEAYGAENVAFVGNITGPECVPFEPAEWLDSTLDGLLDSPGHRLNILRREHTTLHLGISFDCRILTVVQLFEGEYVTYEIPPTIDGGLLVMQGHLHNGATLPRAGPAEGIRIAFWPPPNPLTRGQLFRAAGYCSGTPIASILVPLPAFYIYDSDSPSWSHTGCLTPYASDPQSPAPSTNAQASELMEAAKLWEVSPEAYSGLGILPDIWQVGMNSFVVQADVSQLVAELGPGVYTTLLWGELNGTPIPVSEFAIFVR